MYIMKRQTMAMSRTPSPSFDYHHAKHEEPISDDAILREPARRLRSVEEEAFKAMEMGKYPMALYLRMQGFAEQVCWHAQKAIESCDISKGGEATNDVLVSSFLSMAKGMLLKGNTECINYLQKALHLNREVHGDEHLSNAQIHEAFVDYYIHLGDQKSAAFNKEAFLEGKSESDDFPFNRVTENPGDEFYGKAVEELQKAWEVIDSAQSTLGSSNKAFELRSIQKTKASIYTKMAQTQAKQEKYEDAGKNYKKAISAHSEADVPNSQILTALNYELGVVFYKLQNYEDSIKVLKEAAKHFEKQEKENRNETVRIDILKQQSITIQESGDLEAAMESFQDLVILQQQHYGTNNIVLAETLTNMGDISLGLNKIDDANTYYQRALKILQKRLGPSEDRVKQLLRRIKRLEGMKIEARSIPTSK